MTGVNKMLKKTLLGLLLLTYSLQAEIVEIYHMDDIRTYITNQNDLVLFDVDDTLITNQTSLGAPAWRSWIKPKVKKYDLNFPIYDALTFYVAKSIDYQATEPGIPALIFDLQQKDVVTFAFTSRGRGEWYTTNLEGVDEFTHQQLNRVGIDFNKTKVPEKLISLENLYFDRGILFSQHIAKGDLLKHLFQDLNYTPSTLIFIDDKLDQVKSVETAALEMGIPFIGFWYRHSEFVAKKFNPMLTNVQLTALLLEGVILSDEEAQQILDTLPAIDAADYFDQLLQSIELDQLRPSL